MCARGYRMDQSRKATAEDSWLSLTRARGTRGHDCSWDPTLAASFLASPWSASLKASGPQGGGI